ncbi:tRNA uridine-5-carboxymethylaminomethyl(34) synthesis enzyme MnmG, partial [Enterococcus faecalis]
IARLGKHRIKPTKEVHAFLETKGAAGLKDGILATDFLKRPEISYQEVAQFFPAPEDALDSKEIELVEIQIKYEGYIKKA